MESGIEVLYVGRDLTDFNPKRIEHHSDSIALDIESTADDGFARLTDDTIDCVVSTYDLPESDGIDFLKRVRDRYPELPFILVPDDDSGTVASDAIAAGTTDYIPYDPSADIEALLGSRIETAVEQYHAHRRAEEQQRISSVIRDVNRALVRAESADDVEQAVCDILSEADPYLTACIAEVNPDTMRIEPRTWRGGTRGYFENLDMVVAEDAPGRHAPGGRAYHDREIAISQNITEDPNYEKWRPEATDRGFQALAVVPLEYNDELQGLLAVFADRPQAFDDREQQLLSELGDDIAHALHAQQLQSELRTTSSRLQALFEQSPDMINVHDADGNITDPNPRLCQKTGYDEATLTGMNVWDLDGTIDAEQARTRWDGMDEGDTHRLEGVYERVDGSTFPVEIHIRRLELADDDCFLVISRDITERKHRQQELERYGELIENLPVGVFRTAPDGEIINTNPELASLYGAESKAALADMPVEELYVDDDDRESLLAELEADGVVEGETLRVQTLDGEERWVEVTLRLVEENGQQYLDGVVQDITERRERKQRLEESETLFEHAQDGLFLIDVGDAFRVQRVNPAYEELTGVDAEAVVGGTPVEILGKDSGKEVEAKYRECVRRHMPLEYEEELRIGGDRSYWATRVAPVVVDGEVEKLVGSTRNITDRKERERSLRRNERRFEAMLNDPHILVGVLDIDGTILHANDTALEYIDAGLEDVQGSKLWMTAWWSEELRPIVKEKVEQAAGGEYVTYEADLTYPSGEPYNVVGVIRPVRDADGRVVSLIISARDITEREKREQQLDAMDRVLRHNLHNEMSIVLGAAETIADRAGGDVAELAEMILTSTRGLLEVTNKQRDIVELVTEAPDVTSINVTGLVRRIVERVSEVHPAAEITLSISADVSARAIPQLGSAVGELVENAIVHTDEASPSIEVRVETTGERVQISVADTGPRIPSAERAILRGEGEGGPLYHGSGMGLWLVNWVVSRSDGIVTWEQNRPSGNLVTIDVPASQPGRENR